MNELEMGILEKIKPDEGDEKEVLGIGEKLLRETRREVEKVDAGIIPILVGSISRGTWLKYEKDVDIFLKFPTKYEKEELEKVVTKTARKILKNPVKRYAQHPYVTGEYEGYEVEIVPCYDIESTSQLKSAVDRTPFHDRFIKANIEGGEDEVRLLKQFLKGVGCYGAEAKVEGFSGYLCELLIVFYGSFENVVKSALNWEAQHVIDLYDDYDREEVSKKFSSPLVFIDPVDKNRNVASALSEQKFYEFAVAAREFLKSPSEKFFFPEKRRVERAKLLKKFGERTTSLIAITFSKPNVVDDVLYPQLRRACHTIKNVLNENDFRLMGLDFSVSDKVYILVELENIEIPTSKIHFGPQINSPQEEKFLKKYEDFEKKLTEPFIKGDRWCILIEREYTNAKDLLVEFLSQKDLGKRGMPRYISAEIGRGFEIKVNKGVFLEEFLGFLQGYLDPRFPWQS
ncbi:MAG: CCA tRNA nucleotidyltransferase [Candidatus Hydrothermarchaeales archaeon]